MIKFIREPFNCLVKLSDLGFRFVKTFLGGQVPNIDHDALLVVKDDFVSEKADSSVIILII